MLLFALLAISQKTSLIIAVINGHTETAEELHRLGATLEAKDDGVTVLMGAAVVDDAKTVKALHQLGANLEAKTSTGMTALLLAAARGHTKTVEALLRLGANLEAKSNTGMTALMYATYYGHSQLAKNLVENGAFPIQTFFQMLRSPISRFVFLPDTKARPLLATCSVLRKLDVSSTDALDESILEFEKEKKLVVASIAKHNFDLSHLFGSVLTWGYLFVLSTSAMLLWMKKRNRDFLALGREFWNSRASTKAGVLLAAALVSILFHDLFISLASVAEASKCRQAIIKSIHRQANEIPDVLKQAATKQHLEHLAGRLADHSKDNDQPLDIYFMWGETPLCRGSTPVLTGGGILTMILTLLQKFLVDRCGTRHPHRD